MLKTYTKIEHSIFGVHKLIGFLVLDVFCKANHQSCYSKLNDDLKSLYNNVNSDWFKNSIEDIYNIIKDIENDRDNLKLIFENNNKIEYLCSNPKEILRLELLSGKLVEKLKPFFKELYKKILSWEFIKKKYGTKKEYYNALKLKNDFGFCPCCGFGLIKHTSNKGHSAFDHYLPLVYYPFSAINFDNLFPLCNECNSDNKGSKDVLLSGEKIFYPFNEIHPIIEIDIKIREKDLFSLFRKNSIEIEEISKEELEVNYINIIEYSEELRSWDLIFDINQRFFEQVKSNGKHWLTNFSRRYNLDKDRNSFDDIISNVCYESEHEQFYFLKKSFLHSIRLHNDSLVEAMNEVSGDYLIAK
jgi:hypothetical protein